MASLGRGAQVLEAHGMTIAVHVFPDDVQLWRDVRRIALAVAPESTDETSLRRLVQGALHRWYPRVVIARKESLASLAEECVWYVLRDGRVTRPQERIDRMYHAMSDARETTSETAAAMDHAAQAVAGARRAVPRRETAAGSLPGGERAGVAEADQYP